MVRGFLERLYLSSVQLVRLDAKENHPTGAASGALIDYAGKRLLITVEHATGDQARWAIQLRYAPGIGTQLYGVGAMNFLARASLAAPKPPEIVDFAYVQVPASIQAYRQKFDVTGTIITDELPITIHTPNLTDIPAAGENYGFCGMVKAGIEHHPGRIVLGGDIRSYSGLKYVRRMVISTSSSSRFHIPVMTSSRGAAALPF